MKHYASLNKNYCKILIITGIIFILFGSTLSTGIDQQTVSTTEDPMPYEGTLRIYIVEPESRWDNYDGDPYHFGFLDFAFNDGITLDYQQTYSDTITWDATQAGYFDVQQDNIMVIAALFNPEIHAGYSYPPMGAPFEAHYVDATAAAIPGETGTNTVTENFTHTVFVEEATAEYCPYCPAMANALQTVYESGEYPFYFTALITKDKRGNTINQVALDYMIENYNHYAYPTAHFDGGYKTMVGGYDNPDSFARKIASAIKRDVHEVDFSISVTMNNKVLSIEVSITNNEDLTNQPPGIPTITGPTTGKAGEEYTYEITAEDPDGDDLYFIINWGDETEHEIVGPYRQGRTAKIDHNWSAKGTYSIQVQSRDVYDDTSDWATLEISMQKQKEIRFQLLEFIRDRFPMLSSFFQRVISSI